MKLKMTRLMKALMFWWMVIGLSVAVATVFGIRALGPIACCIGLAFVFVRGALGCTYDVAIWELRYINGIES
jgi:hypothetical protein